MRLLHSGNSEPRVCLAPRPALPLFLPTPPKPTVYRFGRVSQGLHYEIQRHEQSSARCGLLRTKQLSELLALTPRLADP